MSGLRFCPERHSAAEREVARLTDRLMFRISSDVRRTHTQDGSILLNVHHGQMFCMNLVGLKILELLECGYDEARIAREISHTYVVAQGIASNDVRDFLDALCRHHILQPIRSNSNS